MVSFGRQEFHLESWGDFPIQRLVVAFPGGQLDVVCHMLLERL